MTARTSGAIALQPMGNTQGTHYFLNINSGRRVACNNWTSLPMPNKVIQAIHRLAAACKKHKGIVFADRHGNIIDDNSPDEHAEGGNLEITGVSIGVDNTKIAGVDNAKIAGVSTGLGNTEITTNNNILDNTETTYHSILDNTVTTEFNENIEDNNYTTNNNQDIQEIHTTCEDEEEPFKEPTRHNEQIIEEMNAANM